MSRTARIKTLYIDRAVAEPSRCGHPSGGGSELPVCQGQTQSNIILGVGNKDRVTRRRQYPQTPQQGRSLREGGKDSTASKDGVLYVLYSSERSCVGGGSILSNQQKWEIWCVLQEIEGGGLETGTRKFPEGQPKGRARKEPSVSIPNFVLSAQP